MPVALHILLGKRQDTVMNKMLASAILTTYCFKRLVILSLREVAVLLRNRVDQIGIGDKETIQISKNNKQYNMRAMY